MEKLIGVEDNQDEVVFGHDDKPTALRKNSKGQWVSNGESSEVVVGSREEFRKRFNIPSTESVETAAPEIEIDDEAEIVAEDEESEIEASSEEEVEEVDENLEEEKQYKNPHARARVLEKQAKALKDQLIYLQGVVQELAKGRTQEVSEEDQVEEEVQEEEVIDQESDPLGFIAQEMKKLKSAIDENKQQANKEKIITMVRSVDAAADNLTKEYSASVGQENFTAAMQYLVEIAKENLEDAEPGATEAQKQQMLINWATKMRRKAVLENRNPGEEFYKLALRYRYKPTEKKMETKKDAVEAIKDKAKAAPQRPKAPSESKTISVLGGASPKPKIPDMADPESWNKEITDKIKTGALRVAPGSRRSPRLRDIAGHRAIKV